MQRSLRLVQASNPDTQVAKNVFDLSVAHTAHERPGTLAYAIVPGADTGALERYDGRRRGPVILANSTELQAIRHPQLGLVADDGRTAIAVSDPTFGRDEVAVTGPGRRRVETPHDGVQVQSVRGGTRLVFTTRHAYGTTISVTLQGRGIV